MSTVIYPAPRVDRIAERDGRPTRAMWHWMEDVRRLLPTTTTGAGASAVGLLAPVPVSGGASAVLLAPVPVAASTTLLEPVSAPAEGALLEPVGLPCEAAVLDPVIINE